MPRYLGVDPGGRRVGLALSDETGTLASPLEVVDRENQDLDDRLRTVLEEFGVERVVVGYPVPLRTDENERTRQVDRFIERYVEPLPVPYTAVSERYSTAEADELRRRRDAGGTAGDDEAAALILDRFLERRRRGRTGDADPEN